MPDMPGESIVTPASVAAPTKRILSIDVLRGLTVAFMILANNPGDGRVSYRPLDHAEWNGWTPTDLIFPTFLFLVGCSIVFSVGSRLARGVPRTAIFWQVVKRSFWILVISYSLRLLPDFSNLHHVRLFGVLPRIAVVYLCAAGLFLISQRARSIVITLVVLLVGYYVLLRFVPVPGAGIPGRDVPFMDPYNNLTAYIDRGFNGWTQRYLHTGYLYVKYRDPEGWLSTLPAIGTGLLGILAGKLIRSAQPAKRVCVTLLGAGIASILAGEVWSLWFPINKNLWTSSFVLLAAGIAALLLALTYWIYDTLQLQHRSHAMRMLSWPWIVFGSNAITAYVMGSVWGKTLDYIRFRDAGKVSTPLPWLYAHVFAHGGSTANSSLAFAMFYVVLCFLPVWVLWRRGIFLRV